MTGFWVYLNRSDLGSCWHNGTAIESSVVQIISHAGRKTVNAYIQECENLTETLFSF